MTRKKENNVKKLLPLVAGLSLAVLAAAAYYFSKSVKSPTSGISPTLSVQNRLDNIDDGIYTNYKYGFRFEYPTAIFPSSSPWDQDTGKVFFVDRNTLHPQLKVYIAKYEVQFNDFENCKSNVFVANNNTGVKRIRLYALDKTSSCVVMGDASEDIEPYWFYQAYFEGNNRLIILDWSANSKEKLLTYRKDLDKLVNSFIFIAPTN